MEKNDSIIALDKVSVNYDGFLALRELEFSMRRGELRFVIGPNGAGKTTLLDVITGKVKPTQGHVTFAGKVKLRGLLPYQIANLGIGRKFQTPSVFPHHTVKENMFLAYRTPRSVWHTLRARLSSSEQDKLQELLKMVGLAEFAELSAHLLSHGQKQWLEIGMLLAQDPQLLLLDEPAAGMTGAEREQTGTLLETIARTHSVLVIEHDMEFVRRLARTVTVLHGGALLCEGTMDEVQNNPVVIDVYLGRTEAD